MKASFFETIKSVQLALRKVYRNCYLFLKLTYFRCSEQSRFPQCLKTVLLHNIFVTTLLSVPVLRSILFNRNVSLKNRNYKVDTFIKTLFYFERFNFIFYDICISINLISSSNINEINKDVYLFWTTQFSTQFVFSK